jgi:flagellar biogenesis protein FliO
VASLALHRSTLVLAVLLVVAGGLAAAWGGEVTVRALRATAVVAFLGLAACALRLRRGGPSATRAGALAVRERQLLGRDTGVAVVAVAGRRILVGYGPAGVSRLTELTSHTGSDAS